MSFGGLPEVLNYTTNMAKIEYLKKECNETYVKDIIQRNKIKREDILFSLIEFLSSSIGSVTNIRRITNSINSIEKNKINEKVYDTTIRKYLDCLLDSFLFNEAKRYNIRGRQYFKKNSKFYSVDLGLRNVILNMRQEEKSHEIENLVYNELLFRGYSVDIGVIESYTKDKENKTKRKTQEIDFVVNGTFSQCYIQVSLDIFDTEKEKKELMPFSVINDNFKKIIITKDNGRTRYDQNGICYIDLLNFLLGEEIF